METLADRIAREGPLNELDAVGWAIRLAKRIETMHSLGVTHGSVSPQCVQIEGKDRTARAYLVDVRRTSSNPAYHSPERLNDGALSHADDAWALACTLYEALTGSPPFSGANDVEVRQKVLAGSPAPLAVFDVGDDDLQRVLDDAFARDPAHRTRTVGAVRAALEEWHPDPNVGGLPGLEDEDTGGGIGDDDEDEDERTIMRPAPAALASMKLGAAPGVPAGMPRPVAPLPVPSPKVAPPAPVPPPRASSPGAPRGPLGSASGLLPLAQPRPGAAARLVPPPRGSSPGLPPPAVPPPRASGPGIAPPGLVDSPLMPDDDEDEDEKTMMRAVPDHLGAAIAARLGAPAREPEPPRTNDAGQSGAFAAVSPTKSGAFRAMGSPSALDHHDGDDAEEEATRMLQSPAFPSLDDDEEQATIMRTSTPEEVEQLRSLARAPLPAAGAPPAPIPGSAPLPAAGAPSAPILGAVASEETEPHFAATLALDVLGLAPPPPELLVAPAAGAAAPAETASASHPAGMFTGAASPGASPPAAPFAPPGPLAPPLGAEPVAAPRRGRVVWIAVIAVLLVAAGVTFLLLRFR